MMKPNLFIVGQPRAGTTALHVFLSKHPQICMSSDKEPSFFCNDLHRQSDAFHKKQQYFRYRNLEEYLALFEDTAEAEIVGESSTYYLYSRAAAQEIHTFNPEAKIIILLRNPLDFMHSFHNYLFTETYEDVEDFETALLLEESRRTGKDIPPRASFPGQILYTDWVKYSEMVERYFACFERSRVKLIIYEDFQEDNEKVFIDILNFLGVNTDFAPEFKIINKSRIPRNNLLNFLIQDPGFLNTLRERMPVRLRSWIVEQGKRFVWKDTDRPAIPSRLRLELRRKLSLEVDKIGRLLNKDLKKRWFGLKESPNV